MDTRTATANHTAEDILYIIESCLKKNKDGKYATGYGYKTEAGLKAVIIEKILEDF